ncbi:Na+-driven multidrug efflux pump [Agromyces sp. CF514]|uniref:MATE family efflux transporter n=1 Tax=Agromyces sp. CF514 TaxID=1881031 RepID=UPI0008F0AFDB|nr:MATE family efflux transporter [Agromyces sp. CF514]SFR69666.1 Na+-driven multidrug efflux pump [Agromyces sp. CF514]
MTTSTSPDHSTAPDSPAEPDSPTSVEPPTATASQVDVGSNRWYLSAAPVLRALVHLSVPMAAAFVVSALYNVINAGFIGSQHDTSLLAAVTFGTPILGLIMAVGSMFGVGGGALVSRLLGAAEHDAARADDVKRASSFSLWGAVGAGVLLGALGLVFLQPLVGLLGAGGTGAAAATGEYVAVMLAFMPVLAAAFCLEQLVRAEGAARQAMVGLMLTTAASLAFDVVFILLLHWGVGGVALSMGLANLLAIAYWVRWLRRTGAAVSVSPKWFTLARTTVGPVLSIGVGALGQAAFMIVTSLVLNTLAAGYGEGPLAAMGVAVRIAQVPEFLIMGVTMGVLPLLAYAYGKGDRARLGSAVRTSFIAVGILAVLFSTIVFAFRDQVFGLFSDDSSLLAIGAVIITAQLVAMIANGFTGLLTSLFQACGKAVPSIVMSMAQGVLFIPVVIVANLWFGLPGIIWALTVSEVAVLVAGLGMWLGYRRSIARGLSDGSPERAEQVLAETA